MRKEHVPHNLATLPGSTTPLDRIAIVTGQRKTQLLSDALIGSQVERHLYLRNRSFRYSADVPGTLQVELEEIARRYFEKVAIEQTNVFKEEFIGILDREFAKNRMVLDPVRKSLGYMTSYEMSKLLRKLIDKKKGGMPLSGLKVFRAKTFDQLGLERVETLADLLTPVEMEKESSSNMRKAVSDFLGYAKSQRDQGIKPEDRKDQELSPQEEIMLKVAEFNPRNNTTMGEAARNARAAIVPLIVAHVILSDFLESKDIVLHSRRMAALRGELLKGDPFERVQEIPTLTTLATFADYYDERLEPFQYISREEAIERYAFSGRGVELLEETEAKRAIAATSEQRAEVAVSAERQSYASHEKQRTEELQSLVETYYNSDSHKNYDPSQVRRVVNICLKKEVPLVEFERIIKNARGDLNKCILALRKFGQSTKRSISQSDSDEIGREETLLIAPQAEKLSRQIVVFEGTGNWNFSKWFTDLDKPVRERVASLIRKYQDGFDSVKRPVLMRSAIAEYRGVRLWELRDMNGGLRVIFRERPNNEVVLLTGGDKDTQTAAINKAYEFGFESMQDDKQAGAERQLYRDVDELLPALKV
ncbi:MAG: type II toxin-antitoxin system RelE/ParE family toxin [Bdellovibrionales bacterium]|nr:type II toxin-antitoxin system RelE/ParE family toxin [Bdellovibrionales bacterium]